MKTYKTTKYPHLLLIIKKDGKKYKMRFLGGKNSPLTHGQYSTSKPDEIAAMESCSLFNVDFKCVSETVDKPKGFFPSTVKATPVKPVAKKVETPNDVPEDKDFEELIASVQEDEEDTPAEIETQPEETFTEAIDITLEPKMTKKVKPINTVWEVKDVKGVKHVMNVKTAQQAKEFLLEEISGITAYRLRYKSLVLDEAAKHKIKFPNLK